MKFLNNFDTNFKIEEYNKTVKEYGKEKVLLIQRNFFYFFNKGIFPLMLYLVCLVGIGLLVFKFVKNQNILYIILGFAILFTIFVFYKIFNLYLDYKFDFSIFSHKKIFTYKQKGLFFSDYKDLPAAKIRSITSGRTGLLGNIFGYGKVIIYTDGGMSGEHGGRSEAGKTQLSYVSLPNRVRERIWEICVPEEKR